MSIENLDIVTSIQNYIAELERTANVSGGEAAEYAAEASRSGLESLPGERREKLISYLTDRIYVLQGQENPRIPNLKAQLEDTQKRIGNIMDAIEQGIITENTKSRLTQLESKQNELEIAILQEKIKKPFLTKEQIRFGIEKFKKLDISTQEGKQRLIDGFINSIYLFDDKLTITFNFKDGSRTVSFSEIEAAINSDIDCIAAPKSIIRTFYSPRVNRSDLLFSMI